MAEPVKAAVTIEGADPFARELMAQELGIALLIKRKVRLITTSGDDLTTSDNPSRIMIRRVAGLFAEYEKTRLVAKLKTARDAKRGFFLRGALSHLSVLQPEQFDVVCS